jgi:hypothetical protein
MFIAMVSASATPCPTGITATSTYTVNAVPDQPKIGQEITVTIKPRITDSFTVCLDANIVEGVTMIPGNTPDSTQFKLVVPGDPKQAGLTGLHVLSVVTKAVVDNTSRAVVYSTQIGRAPRLDSVTSFPLGPGNSTFRVKLIGEGFDPVNKSYNLVQFNDFPLDVSWSDGSTAECPPRKVCGYVTPDGRVIELAGIEPIEERSARFTVWINSSQSDEQTDSDATSRYGLAIGASATVTLAIFGIVIVLVYKYLRATVIEGDNYVVRALFLDKETNTYSLSKLQFYLWTLVAVFGYVYLAIAKNWFQHFYSLPAVPSGLPGIVAIAAGTAVGAQVVTNINGPKGSGQLKPSLADFVTTGDVVAAERVQFFVWTIIGALGFLMVVLRLDPRVLKDLPDVPSSILAISGLSAFGYLGGKLARDPGPVITETMVGTGPDPDAVPATDGVPTGKAPIANPQTAADIAAAKSQISALKQRVQSIPASTSIQAVVAAAYRSCDAAAAAIQAAGASGDPGTIASRVQKSATDADAASREAATVATSLPPPPPKTDLDNASTAASAAQQASAAAQTVATAVKSASAASVTESTPAASPATSGRIELRGRMLSRDANFRVSPVEDSNANDLDISFDQLQPSSKDDQQLKKPRVVERDSDSTDPNMAKRLLLVINLTEALRPVFVPGTKHTITVVNPDSQKALFKFQVPESQKAN